MKESTAPSAAPTKTYRYEYAQPGNWDAAWGGGKLQYVACPEVPYGPGNDKSCINIDCGKNEFVQCPPEGAPTCPTWKDGHCAQWPNGTHSDWQISCSPLTVPKKRPIDIWCNLEPNPDGTLHCYLFQKAMGAGISFTCTNVLQRSRITLAVNTVCTGPRK